MEYFEIKSSCLVASYESMCWKSFLTSQKLVNTTFTLEVDWTGIIDKTSNSKHERGNDHKSWRQVNCSFFHVFENLWKSLKHYTLGNGEMKIRILISVFTNGSVTYSSSNLPYLSFGCIISVKLPGKNYHFELGGLAIN